MSAIQHFNPTQRFSSKVEAYIKYRPSYPKEALDSFLKEDRELTIADVGSGTGGCLCNMH
jgi:hypothetical protein